MEHVFCLHRAGDLCMDSWAVLFFPSDFELKVIVLLYACLASRASLSQTSSLVIT